MDVAFATIKYTAMAIPAKFGSPSFWSNNVTQVTAKRLWRQHEKEMEEVIESCAVAAEKELGSVESASSGAHFRYVQERFAAILRKVEAEHVFQVRSASPFTEATRDLKPDIDFQEIAARFMEEFSE